jgi:hypothetical protein
MIEKAQMLKNNVEKANAFMMISSFMMSSLSPFSLYKSKIGACK